MQALLDPEGIAVVGLHSGQLGLFGISLHSFQKLLRVGVEVVQEPPPLQKLSQESIAGHDLPDAGGRRGREGLLQLLGCEVGRIRNLGAVVKGFRF